MTLGGLALIVAGLGAVVYFFFALRAAVRRCEWLYDQWREAQRRIAQLESERNSHP